MLVNNNPHLKKRLVNSCHEDITDTVIDKWVSRAASPSHTSMCHLDIMDNNVLVQYQLETKDKLLSLG